MLKRTNLNFLFRVTSNSTIVKLFASTIPATATDSQLSSDELKATAKAPKTGINADMAPNVRAAAKMPQLEPLTDRIGRRHTYLRISLTERCNLRCEYCMPAEGVPLQPKSHLLTTDEIYYLSQVFVQEGVRKIRLTGGEPTVRHDIVDIISRLKSIPLLDQLGITTNGLMLTRLLLPMQRAGLDAINISLDTLRVSRFEKITRRKGWERVIAGIDLAIQLGYKPKINCVLMRNFNEDEICDWVEFTRDRAVDVRFIEYMPFSGNKWHTDRLISYRDTLKIIKECWPNFVALPNHPNDTSKAFTVPGYAGQVGFITSMTEHFCGSCNRLRLTADGNIKVCLFGNKEFSLRDAMRSNCSKSDLVALIGAAVRRKKKQHAATNYKDNQKRSQSTNQAFHLSSPSHSIHVLLPPPIPTIASTSNLARRHLRSYCTNDQLLSHIDDQGKAHMVDIADKHITTRVATASATVNVGPRIATLIAANEMAKGDVLSVAQIAGIMAAKRTATLIPLCHNIELSSVKVSANLDKKNNSVVLTGTVRCNGQTGVEMEALTAVSIAALAVYDMCKAVSHDICIADIHLINKSGGKCEFQRQIDKE